MAEFPLRQTGAIRKRKRSAAISTSHDIHAATTKKSSEDEESCNWESCNEESSNEESSNEEIKHWNQKTYPMRIRNVCDNCRKYVKKQISEDSIIPLYHANVCPGCNHKSIHQPYYTICSVCVRRWRKCAKCLEPYMENEINPEEILLSPTLQYILCIIPDNYQRILYRFMFKKWDQFIKNSSIEIRDFNREFRVMCFRILTHLKTLRDNREIDYKRREIEREKAFEAESSRIEAEFLEIQKAQEKEMYIRRQKYLESNNLKKQCLNAESNYVSSDDTYTNNNDYEESDSDDVSMEKNEQSRTLSTMDITDKNTHSEILKSSDECIETEQNPTCVVMDDEDQNINICIEITDSPDVCIEIREQSPTCTVKAPNTNTYMETLDSSNLCVEIDKTIPDPKIIEDTALNEQPKSEVEQGQVVLTFEGIDKNNPEEVNELVKDLLASIPKVQIVETMPVMKI